MLVFSKHRLREVSVWDSEKPLKVLESHSKWDGCVELLVKSRSQDTCFQTPMLNSEEDQTGSQITLKTLVSATNWVCHVVSVTASPPRCQVV